MTMEQESVAVKKGRVTRKSSRRGPWSSREIKKDTVGLEETPDKPKPSRKSGTHKKGSRAGNNEWSKRKNAMMKACMEQFASSATSLKEHCHTVLLEVFVWLLRSH
jgi:hypothetical protein